MIIWAAIKSSDYLAQSLRIDLSSQCCEPLAISERLASRRPTYSDWKSLQFTNTLTHSTIFIIGKKTYRLIVHECGYNDVLKCVVTALIFCGCNLKLMIAFPFMGLPYCLTRDYDGRLGEIIYLNIASRMLSESHCPKRWLIGPQGIVGKLGRCWYVPPGLKSNWTSHDVPKLQSQPAGHCRAITILRIKLVVSL